MSSKRALGLAVSVWVISLALLITTVAYGLAHPGFGIASGRQGSIFSFVVVLLFVTSFVTVGALLGWKRSANPIGWLLAATGLSYSLATFAILLQQFHSSRAWAELFGGWLWGFGIGLTGTFVLLIFPTGTLPSRRWRPVAWLAGIGIGAFVLGRTFSPGRISGSRLVNPVGLGGPFGPVVKAMQGGFALVVVASIASIVSVGVRYRRSRDLERQQMKWLLYAAGLVLLAILAQVPIGHFVRSAASATNIQNVVATTSFVFVPIAIGIAVLKYRLYDIDVVINKTLVYGSLAAFITAVYVAIVVGIGAALGRGTSSPNLALSILATAVVAVAFQPVRDRVQRLANRLVYGVRATPYEVLAGFVHQVGGTYAAEDVLPRMARALAEGTGSAAATVWLKVGPELRPEAAWPSQRLGDFVPLEWHGNDLPEVPGVSLALPVVHRGEPLGALTLTKPPGEPLSSTERKLTEDLAGQAGLVVRNVALTEGLLARLRDIESSRARIVSAEDEERTRIERRIREGARRELENVARALDQAAVSLRTDPERALGELAAVGEHGTVALESLRDVARGIYPPLLADLGLAAALGAQARRAGVPVTVESDGIGRYPQAVESAVYFCCVEAMQNAVMHGSPSNVRIVLNEEGGKLRFEVVDDGAGFDPDANRVGIGLTAMQDRIAAIDGQLGVHSRRSQGTAVAGWVPLVDAGQRERVPELEPAP